LFYTVSLRGTFLGVKIRKKTLHLTYLLGAAILITEISRIPGHAISPDRGEIRLVTIFIRPFQLVIIFLWYIIFVYYW
jgi:hypothetical protein